MGVPRFPLLILLFIASGAAALIYEIVWFQLLQLIIGSTAVSLGVLLATFMGGMCVGSLAMPLLIGRRHHPLRIYAALEMGIGIIGVLILVVMPHAGGLYTAVGGQSSGILLRALICGICLVPPTLLMGATLPAVARWIEVAPRQASWLGFLYGANIAGAVFGCLLTGFYLLRLYDVAVATYVAAGINVSIALIAFLVARTAIYDPPADDTVSVHARSGSRIVYIIIGVSGLCAMGAEVVWTRLLSLMAGASTYTFSIILAVFLLGLGIGSISGAAISRWSGNPRRDLGICQMLIAAGIAWSVHMLTDILPYWPIDPTLTRNPWLNFQLDVVRTALAVLPAACLWGATFPLSMAAAARPAQDPARLAGGLYAANTVGAIIGAVGFSVLFVQWFGSRVAQQMLMGLSVGAALLALAASARPLRKNVVRVMGIAVAGLLALSLMFGVSPTPGGLIAYGRSLPWIESQRDPVTQERIVHNILYVGEGRNASVAVSETPPDIRSFHVSGKIEASTLPEDMRLQRMLGHLPGLVHPSPRSVLIVGFGAGVTAGSFVSHPTVERIVICEIEPLIPGVVAKYFAAQNSNVAEDPRVEIVYDDARHYLLRTGEKFDVISSDPIHPWVKGAAALYTHEYFELVRQHLNPGGVVSQWVPLYSTTTDAVKSELATFFGVFPDGTIWGNERGGKGYDIVLLGGGSVINTDNIVQRLKRSDYDNVVTSLREVGFGSALQMLASYAGRASDLSFWLAGAEINRDRNLRLQYLAGMGLNLAQEVSIYESIRKYRKRPRELFSGTEEFVEQVNRAIERRLPRTVALTQAAAISNSLAAGPARRIAITTAKGDAEGLQFATELAQTVSAAGWQVDLRESLSSSPTMGLSIRAGANPPPPQANELYRALRAGGLSAPVQIDSAIGDGVSLTVGAQE